MNTIFTEKEHLIFAGIISADKKAALLIPLQCLVTALISLFTGLVFIIDWEIFFRIFDYLAGDEGYWSPRLMACTGGIMMLAFHLVAERQPQHLVVKVINRLSGIIIAAFVVGGGLYIASILYTDGMGELGGELPPIQLGQAASAVVSGSWIDLVFEYVTSPSAVLALSLGIGGLSIVSMFIAHHLLALITQLIRQIYTRSKALRSALNNQRIIRDSEARLGELTDREHELVFCDEDHWKLHIADQALDVIAEHLMPHQQYLQDCEFTAPEHRWAIDQSKDVKRVERAVKKLQAISADDILRHLTLPKQLEKTS